MVCIFSTLFVIVCLFKINFGLCSETAGRLFSNSVAYATVGSRPEYTTTVDSQTVCAVQCYSDENCATFEYNKSTRLCRMSAGLVSGAKYGPHVVCPVGYQTYVREKNALCLKFFWTNVKQTTGATTCGDDRARLVLIQTESMLQFVGDIVNGNWQVGGNPVQIWVNGFDADDDGNYETSEGNPLPYVPPGSNMYDEAGSMCIRLVTTPPYTFNDFPCDSDSAIRYVLCEMVV